MDKLFDEHQSRLEAHLAAQDHDSLMQLWAHIIEEAISHHAEAHPAAMSKHRGHGRITITRKRAPTGGQHHHTTNRMATAAHRNHPGYVRLRKQYSRLASFRAHLRLLCDHWERNTEANDTATKCSNHPAPPATKQITILLDDLLPKSPTPAPVHISKGPDRRT